MSSIKDLLQEEKDAESIIKNAEQQAEATLRDAKAKAAELIRRAQSDDALVKELAERNKAKIAALQAVILGECQTRAAEIENHCKENLNAAIELVVDSVTGGRNER